MTTFYCVRHGKTEFNHKRIFQGGLVDSPLLPIGIENAQKAGTYLADISFNRVVVSPQKRAQDTALNLLKNHPENLTIETIEDLKEMTFGEWDGKLEADYAHLEPYKQLVHTPHLYDPSEFGGETFQALLDRTVRVFKQLTLDYPDETILVVSHGLTLLTALKYFGGYPLEDTRKGDFLDNTSITILEASPDAQSFHIESWNDTSFLN